MNEIEKRIDKMIKRSEVILNAGKQTNEEWLDTLSTVEKAKAIALQSRGLRLPYNADEASINHIAREWEKWLKEKHEH